MIPYTIAAFWFQHHQSISYQDSTQSLHRKHPREGKRVEAKKRAPGFYASVGVSLSGEEGSISLVSEILLSLRNYILAYIHTWKARKKVSQNLSCDSFVYKRPSLRLSGPRKIWVAEKWIWREVFIKLRALCLHPFTRASQLMRGTSVFDSPRYACYAQSQINIADSAWNSTPFNIMS